MDAIIELAANFESSSEQTRPKLSTTIRKTVDPKSNNKTRLPGAVKFFYWAVLVTILAVGIAAVIAALCHRYPR